VSTLGSSANATAASVRAGLEGGRRGDVTGVLFQVLLLGSLLFSLAVLSVLIADVMGKALPVFAERGLDFLTSPLSSNPAKAGVAQGIVGTAVLGLIVSVLAFPFGLATAIYLEEYAGDNRMTRFIQINIRNLAGVPSVVYGLLGLSVFVAVMDSLDGEDGNGRNIIAGGMTLAVLVLPIVIITSIEALRAVPNAIREAGYGVGASRWEVTRQLVLPSAAPGVLTGTVLALSRALGETAPLILAGAVLGAFSGLQLSELFSGSYTALPVIVYDWSRKPQDAFRADAAAAIVVLLVITIFANAIAILLRNRYERAW
jgi:phosphate transport system permease protein